MAISIYCSQCDHSRNRENRSCCYVGLMMVKKRSCSRFSHVPRKKLRQYAFVRLATFYKKMCVEQKVKSPLLSEEVFIFLGEIPNMQGHCVIVGHTTGKIYIGYHIEDFEELSRDET